MSHSLSETFLLIFSAISGLIVNSIKKVTCRQIWRLKNIAETGDHNCRTYSIEALAVRPSFGTTVFLHLLTLKSW